MESKREYSAEVRKGTLRKYWRQFLPVWLVPLWVIIVAIYEKAFSLPNYVVWLVYVVFMLSGFAASKPYYRREITLGEAILFIPVLTFGIWIVLVLVKCGVVDEFIRI